MILRKKEKHALLVLYEAEICRVLEILYLYPDKAGDLEDFLPLHRISQLCTETDSREEFGQKLFKELKESRLADQSLFEEILKFLYTTDRSNPVHRLLTCTNDFTRRSDFGKILNNLDGFMKYTDPKKVLEFIESYPRYQEIVHVLKEEISKIEDVEMQKKLILRTVPQLGQKSAYDIMYVIHQKSSQNVMAEAQDFIEKIVPNFMTAYALVDEDRKHPRGRIVVCPISSSLTELMMQIGTPAMEHNPRFTIVDLIWDRIPRQDSFDRMIVESIRERVHIENPIILREYQRELCSNALQGKNTIVTAPTGSGKTVIAANILKHHFQNATRDGKRAKALFMTPNSMILQQQATSLSSYLKHLYTVQTIQGADGGPIKNIVLSKDLIVSTPQMIVNLCNAHIDAPDDVEYNCEEFFLSEFTIIIFDECHSTQKNSPYSNIMKLYHRMKNTGIKPEGHDLPQIVGLTASLGVGTAKNDLQAIAHIAELCANMDVKDLSIVTMNTAELRNFSPIIPDKCVYCPRVREDAAFQFLKVLSDMMIQIETKMLGYISDDGAVNVVEGRNSPNMLEYDQERSYSRNEFKTPPLDKELEAYDGWVSNHLKLVAESKFRSEDTKRNVYESLQLLKVCYKTTIYNNSFNSKVAMVYLKENIEGMMNVLTQEMIRIWDAYQHRLSQYRTEENGMITTVREYLTDQFAQNPDFRAIIFVKTRSSARILSDILNGLEELKRCNIVTEYISGLNTNADSLSASKKVQQEKIEKFANGDIRVLVATSVAEEGLDIAKCNLVIKYNYATNEIAHVQRRGRGRALNSTCVLITNSEKLKNQEDTNKNKEILMKSALETILRGDVNFERMVEKQSSLIWQTIQQDEMDRANTIKEQINSGLVYRIICSKCSVLLCRSTDMRSRNTQYYVCDPNIWGLIRTVPLSPEEAEANNKYGGKGKVKCRGSNCGADLGRLIEVNSVDLPCLAAQMIVLEYDDNGVTKRHVPKKWKSILSKFFTPAVIRNLDIANMKDAASRILRFTGELSNAT